jgi:hypothetical protein
MKKYLIIVLALLFILALAACGTGEPPAATPLTADEPADNGEPAGSDEDGLHLKPLELIGKYAIDEDGDLILTELLPKGECAPEEYRKYFFGAWEYTWKGETQCTIIDDSEQNNVSMWLRSRDLCVSQCFWKVGDDVIVFESSEWFIAEQCYYFININEPNIMYQVRTFDRRSDSGEYEKVIFFFGDDGPAYSDANTPIEFMTRTDKPINQPENGFLSELRKYEISLEYDIDLRMLAPVSINTTGTPYENLEFPEFAPIYLVSQSPDKLVLKSVFASGYEGGMVIAPPEYFDVVYVNERIDGVWVQTVDMIN